MPIAQSMPRCCCSQSSLNKRRRRLGCTKPMPRREASQPWSWGASESKLRRGRYLSRPWGKIATDDTYILFFCVSDCVSVTVRGSVSVNVRVMNEELKEQNRKGLQLSLLLSIPLPRWSPDMARRRCLRPFALFAIYLCVYIYSYVHVSVSILLL